MVNYIYIYIKYFGWKYEYVNESTLEYRNLVHTLQPNTLFESKYVHIHTSNYFKNILKKDVFYFFLYLLLG